MKLSIVTPVYNEEQTLSPFLSAVIPVLETLTADYEVIFALDPSQDRTQEIILQHHASNPRIKLIRFSRRFGQPMAVLAGLQESEGDAVVVMDVDLQDPPELIPTMVAKWREGFDVICTQRVDRAGETWLKRILCHVGYRVIHRIAEGIDIPLDSGDFRLMSRRVVEQVNSMQESHGFLRGMVALVGFRQTSLPFSRPARQSGKGKYNPHWGSLEIALNGLICFSRSPLRISFLLGLSFTGFSLLIALIYGVLKFRGMSLPFGNPTMPILILILAGAQLISVGILGEYIGRIYDEIRHRPRYIVDKKVGIHE